MTRPKKTFPVSLLCTCGATLPVVNVAGEFYVTVQRSCECGLKWRIELAIAGWTKDVPFYRVRSVSPISD